MDLKKKIDRFYSNVQKYIDLEVEHIKLSAVERLSFFLNDTLSWLVIISFAFLSFVALIAMVVIVLAEYIGYFAAFAMLAVVFFFLALMFFLMRKKLFVNIAVRRLSRMFFGEKYENDEKEL